MICIGSFKMSLIQRKWATVIKINQSIEEMKQIDSTKGAEGFVAPVYAALKDCICQTGIKHVLTMVPLSSVCLSAFI